MSEFMIVPDIHADASRLDASVKLARPSNRLAFLGDFIDAGASVQSPDDKAVLHKVRAACEDGQAIAVMGNHELNAVLFHRTNTDGTPLRAHTEKNLSQHRSFCRQFGIGTTEALEWTDWFLTLPLWQDLGGLRLVHACWSSSAIETIAARRPDAKLREEDLEEVAGKQTAFAKAVNLLVTGPELALPKGVSFRDASGHTRYHVRIAWWRANAPTWRMASLSVPDPMELPDEPINGQRDVAFYPPDDPPVFVGHYKMQDAPTIEVPNAVCLDFPSMPVVYTWRGEASLKQAHLLQVT